MRLPSKREPSPDGRPSNWPQAPASLADYLAWVAANARKVDGVELAIRGDTDEELAASFVAEMERSKLARIDAR